MKIAIVGTGYVGLVSGTCFAEMGVDVTCVDIDREKIENLEKGIIPIYEPGLEDMVQRNVKAERLHFTTNLTSVLNDIQVIFSAVGTPPDADGSADLKYVLEVARTIGQNMQQYVLLVTKSTVPVGTALLVRQTIQAELDKRGVSIEFDVASNPEFLKEGDAIKDFMSPDRVVVGVESEKAKELITKLYRPFLLNNFRVIFMDILSAEMTKYAANAMLATRISFMNDMANLCELVGADVNMVRKGIGTDQRIGGKFLYAVNAYQKQVLFHKLEKHFKSNLEGKTVCIWGLSFKPNTDDMREAPSLVLIDKLLRNGCKVRAFDPVSMHEAKQIVHSKMADLIKADSSNMYFANDIYDAVLDADALLLVTEWKEFRMPSWGVVKKSMKGTLVLDGRNIYDKNEMSELGFIYNSIG